MHDDIHGRTGGSGGHMSSLDVSAMDPIFWLHHCNVDRLWAIWQDLNPNEFMTARPAPFSNFTVRSGTLEDARTPLSPFWDRSGNRFWTSEEVKSSKVFGYAYPETQSWAFKDTATYQRETRRTIARIYGSNPFVNFARTIAPVDKAAGRPTIKEAEKPEPRSGKRALAVPMKLAAVAPKEEEQKPVEAEKPEPKSGMRALAANVMHAVVSPKKEEQKPVEAAPQEEKAASSEGHDEHEAPENPIDEGDLSGMSN